MMSSVLSDYIDGRVAANAPKGYHRDQAEHLGGELPIFNQVLNPGSASPIYRAIPGNTIADMVNIHRDINAKFESDKAAYDILKDAYNAAIVPKTADLFEQLFSTTTTETVIPVRPDKPTLPENYKGLYYNKIQNTTSIVHPSSSHGGAGLTTVGDLTISGGGKSFGVFG